MACYKKEELLAVLFGLDEEESESFRQAAALDEKYNFPSPEETRHFTLEQLRELEIALRRHGILTAYWMSLKLKHMTRRQAAAKVKCHRDTLREWEKRYRQEGWRGLIPRSRARHTPPARTARTPAAVAYIVRHRQHYTDDKSVLREYMCREGFEISESSVSRILREEKEKGAISRLTNGLLHGGQKKHHQRPHAVPRRQYAVWEAALGKVQMDHKHVTFHGTGKSCKVFCIRDINTKAVYMMPAANATAAAAVRALLCALQQAGYKFTEIQTDHGSEFMSVFEQYCKEAGIAHYLIPFGSPKYNALVENSFKYLGDALLNRDPTIAPAVESLQKALDRHCQRYNDKPNSGLRHFCPLSGTTRLLTPNEMKYNIALFIQTGGKHPMPKMC